MQNPVFLWFLLTTWIRKGTGDSTKLYFKNFKDSGCLTFQYGFMEINVNF